MIPRAPVFVPATTEIIRLRASPEDSGKLVHYSDYFFFDFPVKILVIVLMSAVVKTTSPFLT